MNFFQFPNSTPRELKFQGKQEEEKNPILKLYQR